LESYREKRNPGDITSSTVEKEFSGSGRFLPARRGRLGPIEVTAIAKEGDKKKKENGEGRYGWEIEDSPGYRVLVDSLHSTKKNRGKLKKHFP